MPDLTEDEKRTARDLARIARINEVSAMARTSWIAMLGYFAFVFVTLLGVADADFFVPSRQTDLPLVNVAIPTASFFWFAPALGAALYVYLHIVLLKLWDAIADLENPQVDGHPVGDLINPWLANDWALTKRGSDFTPARPLRTLGNLATLCLVWLAGAFVLYCAWWWSMPAHDEVLTLWLGACFLVAAFAGVESWRAARAWLIPPRREPVHRRLCRWPGALAAIALMILVSWVRTEGGLDRYAGRAVDLTNLWLGRDDKTGFLRRCHAADFGRNYGTIAPLPDCVQLEEPGEMLPRDIVQEGRIATVLPTLDDLTFQLPIIGEWNPLAATDIAHVEMVARPDGWRDVVTALRAYRETWCRREGLEMEVCGQPAMTDGPTPDHIWEKRRAWCVDNKVMLQPTDDDAPCRASFSDFDRRFGEQWRTERDAVLAELPQLSLDRADLRRAAAAGVSLEGATLSGARLEGADLSDARLEGTDLSKARLLGADLSNAGLEGANLSGTRLENANLSGAKLQGADLSNAWLTDANLSGARLEGAKLSGARLQGANFYKTQMDGVPLFGANLTKANMRKARMEGAELMGAVLREADLASARLKGADLRLASLSRANLRETDLRQTIWGSGPNWVSLAPTHSADFRGSQNLTQSQLEHFIGNDFTLLPDHPNGSGRRPHDPTSDAYYVWSCWETPPDDLDAIVARAAGPGADDADRENLRREFLCGPGNPRRRTGTPLALDAPYPEGHPFLRRRD